MKWAAVKACPVYGGTVKSYDFERIRHEPGVISAVEIPIPDPSLIRDRVFSGGVAVIAESWYQAKTAIDKMPIEWDVPPANAARNTRRHARHADRGRWTSPAACMRISATATASSRAAARIVEATYSTPYLPRARMEPGNATVLVTDDRVDIWIGDQSPQETRYSASRITGIPEANVYLHLCHLGGGYGRNGNGPQAEQAIYIANQNRGTPIHLLWTREEDFISTTYRSMGVARLRAALDADGWPIAFEVRTAMDEKAPGAIAAFDKAPRYFAPNYRFSTHSAAFHIPVGTRRGVGEPAHDFYRESFMDELAHAAGKDPYLYRRELISRTRLPYKADMIKALDMAAEMSGWGKPLPHGMARAIALEERGAEGGGHATISAHGPYRLDQPAGRSCACGASTSPMKKASGWSIRCRSGSRSRARSPGSTTTPCCRTAMWPTAASPRTTSTDSRCRASTRIRRRSTSRFFKTGHWLRGMGHDRATSVQSGIADAIFQITGKRYRDLPFRNHDLTWS